MDLTSAKWRKSSCSNANGGACVEVARNLPDAVAVRDSKDPDGPRLAFRPEQWQVWRFTAPGQGRAAHRHGPEAPESFPEAPSARSVVAEAPA